MKLKLSLVMSGVLAISGCGGSGENDLPDTYSLPVNTSVEDPTSGISDSSLYNSYSVHDPSVIKTDGAYYVFGSHLDAAKTTNLQTWEAVSQPNGDMDASPLFDVYTTVAAEGIEWTDGFVGSWASDVIEAPNGEYWFYYNHCAFDNPNTEERDEVCWHRSYLGLAKSDSVEGPYENVGVFLRSGYESAEELAMYPVEGVTEYNPAIHPNVIDPAAFYDAEGNMWMVYGSYSGGIFILALDETTGLPEEGQGYGTHLVGGDFNAIEGSFVMYSPESEYYYLFWSNGGFAAEGGYNIRVARSRTPDGPYLDAAGNDMVNATVANNMGTKLMGGFNFVSLLGETSKEWGYRSPGHNSALYDEELGKHLLFTHTRFPEGQASILEAHEVRVHEMWLNKDGWLVASPYRYAPIDGDNIVDPKDLAGDYRMILQGIDTNLEVKTSEYVTLTEQGRRVEGGISGTYKLFSDEPNRIVLNVDDSVYEGVMQFQWNVEDERFEPVISAMNAAGATLWAAKLEDKTPEEVVADIGAAMTLPSEVKDGTIDLPTEGTRGAEIMWSSSNPLVITDDGRVIRPNVGEGDQDVVMTAHVSIYGETYEYPIDVMVPQRVAYNRVAHFAFENDLTESLGFFEPATGTASRPYIGGSVGYAAGNEGQAVNLDGTNGVRLPTGLINNAEYTVSFWMNPTAIQAFVPGFFAAVNEFESAEVPGEYYSDQWINLLAQSWDGNTMLWSHYVDADNDRWFDGSAGIRINEGEWTHVAFSVNQGFVRVMLNGVEMFAGGNLTDMFTGAGNEGVFTLGTNYWDASFNGMFDELKIYDAAMVAEEVAALDIDKLPESELIVIAEDALDLGDLSFVLDDLILPHTGPFASALAWSSSHPDVIDPLTGAVTRPARGEPDVEVTLTATITLGAEMTTKSFVATVISNTPPAPVARFSFEDNLSDSQGNFDDGQTADKGIVVPSAETNTYVDGAVGRAIEFLGDAGPGVKLPNGLITDHTYTVAMWLNPTALTQFTTAFFGWATDSSWISMVPFGPGAGNTMLWSGTAWFDGDTGTQIPAGEWSHVVIVINAGSFDAYVNGELTMSLANFPDVFTPVGAASQFSLATNFWDINYNGLMDELVIYDDPITADDVAELYAEATAE